MPFDKEIHFSVTGPEKVFALADSLGLELEGYNRQTNRDEKLTVELFLKKSKIFSLLIIQ